MRKIIFIVIIFTIGLTAFFRSYLQTHAFPNTYIASINVSGKSRQNIQNNLIEMLKQPLNIQIKDRVYQYRYSDLGIQLNIDSSLKTIFESNNRPFFKNLQNFLAAFHSNALFLPALTFNQDYYQFADDSVYDFSQKNDAIAVDNAAKRLVYQQNEEKYTIDPQSLKTQIIMNFGKPTILKPHLVRQKNKSIAKVLGMNTVLTHVFDVPIHIVLADYQNSPTFTVPADQLKQLINIHYEETTNQLGIDFVNERLKTLTDTIHDYLKMEPDKKIDEENLRTDLVGLVNARSLGQTVDTISAKTHFTPNSNGTIAKRYIEVDISQQTMYLFDNGGLYHTYKISTGLYYPTPVGQFKIMNKAVNAYSDIYHVWMPYWMAFYYGPEVNAYFGIHELPYWVAGDGQKIQRPREFIGSPHTGGCVALDVGAAREVYAFADVGMPVVVYN